jgi:hypothetical protein
MLLKAEPPEVILMRAMSAEEVLALPNIAQTINSRLPTLSLHSYVQLPEATERHLLYFATLYRKEGWKVSISFDTRDRYLAISIPGT